MRSPHWPRALELASTSRSCWVCSEQRVDAFVLARSSLLSSPYALRWPPSSWRTSVAHLVELAGHRDELLVDQRLLAVELGARPHALLLEERLVRFEQAIERLVVGVALLVGEAGDLLGERTDRVGGGARSTGSGAGLRVSTRRRQQPHRPHIRG